MNKKIRERLKKVPQFVRDAIFEDWVGNAIGKIIDDYINEDRDKLIIIKNTIALTILKDIKIEELFSSIKKELNFDDKTANEITLIILCEILYPIKDYFPGIKDEILKLGGEVPKVEPKKTSGQMIKRDEEMEKIQEEEGRREEEEMKDTIVKKPIEDLIKEFPEVGEQQIGSQKAIIIKDMPVPMKPLVKYWMQDYLEKMGNFEHSNIDRVKYVYHDKNTRTMNDEERRQLNLILKSLDEKIALAYSTRMKKVDFSKTGE